MVSRVAPVLAFFAVIFTLGTRALDASLTTPESVAVGVCPNATALPSSAIRVAINKPFLLVINRCSFQDGFEARLYIKCADKSDRRGFWSAVPSNRVPKLIAIIFSVQISSAVTKNHLPGDQLGVVAGQKRYQRGQVLRLAPLLDGLLLPDAVERLLVGIGHRAL